MKIRIFFVSNSSSASFVLDKKYLSPNDIQKIKEIAPQVPSKDEVFCDSWRVEEDDSFLYLTTIMDNGYLLEWIRENLNIPLKALMSYNGD